ncbi:MAG: hypothetical protein N3A63_09000 [Bacteroidetes bacterium]|nr:hypothetical protein [Bacteroidota bacterium]
MAGIGAWLFLFVMVAWCVVLLISGINLITQFELSDLWTVIIGVTFTGYCIEFALRSRSEIVLDETIDFIKEALLFRRSTQRRITVLELLAQRREERIQKRELSRKKKNSERELLELEKKQHKLQQSYIKELQEGSPVSLLAYWNSAQGKYPSHEFYTSIVDLKIDPGKKRLMVLLNLDSYNTVSFDDGVAELRLFRQVYDFIVCIIDDPRLRHFTPFFESVYLLCRRLSKTTEGEQFYYPFLKVGARIDEIQETIGKYFNPRKFSTIAAVAFKRGLPV